MHINTTTTFSFIIMSAPSRHTILNYYLTFQRDANTHPSFEEVRREFIPKTLIEKLIANTFDPFSTINDSIAKITTDHYLLRRIDDENIHRRYFENPNIKFTTEYLKENLDITAKLMMEFFKYEGKSSEENQQFMMAIQNTVCSNWYNGFKNFILGNDIDNTCTFTASRCNRGMHPFSLRYLKEKMTPLVYVNMKKNFVICDKDILNGSCDCNFMEVTPQKIESLLTIINEKNTICKSQSTALAGLGYNSEPEFYEKEELVATLESYKNQVRTKHLDSKHSFPGTPLTSKQEKTKIQNEMRIKFIDNGLTNETVCSLRKSLKENKIILNKQFDALLKCLTKKVHFVRDMGCIALNPICKNEFDINEEFEELVEIPLTDEQLEANVVRDAIAYEKWKQQEAAMKMAKLQEDEAKWSKYDESSLRYADSIIARKLNVSFEDFDTCPTECFQLWQKYQPTMKLIVFKNQYFKLLSKNLDDMNGNIHNFWEKAFNNTFVEEDTKVITEEMICMNKLDTINKIRIEKQEEPLSMDKFIENRKLYTKYYQTSIHMNIDFITFKTESEKGIIFSTNHISESKAIQLLEKIEEDDKKAEASLRDVKAILDFGIMGSSASPTIFDGRASPNTIKSKISKQERKARRVMRRERNNFSDSDSDSDSDSEDEETMEEFTNFNGLEYFSNTSSRTKMTLTKSEGQNYHIIRNHIEEKRFEITIGPFETEEAANKMMGKINETKKCGFVPRVEESTTYHVIRWNEANGTNAQKKRFKTGTNDQFAYLIDVVTTMCEHLKVTKYDFKTNISGDMFNDWLESDMENRGFTKSAKSSMKIIKKKSINVSNKVKFEWVQMLKEKNLTKDQFSLEKFAQSKNTPASALCERSSNLIQNL